MKQSKMNKKGFSLVELIIVIAIMAVLIGTMAPQYLKFVRNARVASDVTNAEQMAKAINVAIAEPNGSTVPLHIEGRGGTTVANVPGLPQLPNCKYDSSFEWEITSQIDMGVEEITLNGYVIYSRSAAANDYYAQYYSP